MRLAHPSFWHASMGRCTYHLNTSPNFHILLQVRILDYLVRWKHCDTTVAIACANNDEGPWPAYEDGIAQRIFQETISLEELARQRPLHTSSGWCVNFFFLAAALIFLSFAGTHIQSLLCMSVQAACQL